MRVMCSFSKKTLIIIPSHNEEKSLPGVIKAIRTFASDVDVLVVNDASADGTSCVARAAGAIVLDLAHNLGIGGAMQTGFRYARYKGYELALQIDGDGQHPAKFVNDLRKDVIDSNVDLVVGSRFMKDAGFKGFFFQRIGIRYFSVLIKMLTGINVLDVTSGFRAFSKRAIPVFSEYYPHDYPEVESLVFLKNLGH